MTDFDNLESQFKDNLQINKVKYGASTQNQKKVRDEENYTRKNRYPKPTPLDLQLKERHTFINFAYSTDLVYEWNIDGMSEYEILNLSHEMTLFTNVDKNSRKMDHQIAHLIVTSFIGQLKSWWDHYLNNSDRPNILSVVKMNLMELL